MSCGHVVRLADMVPSIQVGMAADIFAAGLDREVDALLQWLKIERTCPGIVHQDDCTMGMGRCRDCGHILDSRMTAIRAIRDRRRVCLV